MPGPGWLVDLTPKQLEVMEWVCQGKTNGEIADILGVSKVAVDSRLHQIYNRLGCYNRTAAAINWLKKL